MATTGVECVQATPNETYMNRTRLFASLVTAAVAAVFVSASNASAQSSNPVELGIDGSVNYVKESGGSNLTTVSIPDMSLRVGFFVSDNVSVEPRVALASYSGGGSSSYTVYSAALGLLLHANANRSETVPYLRPFVGISGDSGGGSSSSSQAVAGAGVGVKIPMMDRLATRLEANYAHAFSSSQVPSSNQFGASFGLSFFTR